MLFVVSAGFPLNHKSVSKSLHVFVCMYTKCTKHDSNSEDHEHREISRDRFVVDRVVNVVRTHQEVLSPMAYDRPSA